MKPKHKHTFKDKQVKTLLRSYKPEDGQMTYIDTTGYDILKQRVCDCGVVETIDLERTKL